MTPPPELREEVARAIVREIARQDSETMPETWGKNGNLTLGYLDQGETDFGTVADAAIAATLAWVEREKKDGYTI